MMVKLRVKSGKKAGAEILVGQTSFIIGRHPESDLQIDSKMVSLRHCLITLKNGYVYVTDLDSRNGTLINGAPIGKDFKATPGDILQVGAFEFEILILPTGVITIGDEEQFEETYVMGKGGMKPQ